MAVHRGDVALPSLGRVELGEQAVGIGALAYEVVGLGAPPADVKQGEGADWRFLFLTVNVVALVVLGLALPAPVGALLNQIVTIVANR